MMRHALFWILIGGIAVLATNAVDAQVINPPIINVVPFCTQTVAPVPPRNLTGCGLTVPPGTTCLETDSNPDLNVQAVTPGQNAGDFYPLALFQAIPTPYWSFTTGYSLYCGVFSDFCSSSTVLVEGSCVTGMWGVPVSALPGNTASIVGDPRCSGGLAAAATINCAAYAGQPHPITGQPMQGVCNPNPTGTNIATCV